MRVYYDEGLANHIGPEPCAGIREDAGEASVGDHAGQPSSRERSIPGADVVPLAEGNTHGCAFRQRPDDPAWSQTLACMDAPCAETGRSLDWPQCWQGTGPHGEGEEPKPMMHDPEKSDSSI